MTIRFEVDLTDRLYCLLERLVNTISHKPKPKDLEIMYIVKTDNPDVAYLVTSPAATDSEGNPIPDAKLDFETTSTDPAVVSITPDTANPLAGMVHFGNPGQASVNINVSYKGKILGAVGAQFTTTVGDPAAITGGSIVFEGLTEAPAEE
jgi:hypothetical protein